MKSEVGASASPARHDSVVGVGLGEIEELEAEVAETERQLSRDLTGLQSIVGGLIARVQRAKAASVKLSRGGTAEAGFQEVEGRVQNLSVPAIEIERFHRVSHQARHEAARVRAVTAEELRQAIKNYAAELSRFTSQLTADEAALAQFERKLREKAREEDTAELARISGDRLSPERAGIGSSIAPWRIPDGRRDQIRIPMQVAIDFSTASNFYVGFSSDISEGGVFIATSEVIPIGNRVELSFRLPGADALMVIGEVRWIRQANDATPEIFPGIGIRFIDLSDAALAIIQKFVVSRGPMFYPE